MEYGSQNETTVNLDANSDDLNSFEDNEIEICQEEWVDGMPNWLRSIDKLTADDIIGMTFGSEDEAVEFYRAYARSHGFAGRKDDVGRDLNGNINMRVMVCSREGLKKKKKGSNDIVKFSRPITRTNCQARMRVNLDGYAGKWRVTAFVEAHNHELTDMKYVQLMPQYRSINDAEITQAETLHGYGIKTRKIMGIMIGQVGGYSELGFGKKDLQNMIDRRRRQKVCEGDAKAAISYLEGKAEREGGDVYNYTTTEDKKLGNLFWVDGIARMDYKCFGDVLAFDTTYKRNKYNKPLVIFSGCNHHRQTVIFGCALLENETIETYIWVLKEFLAAMGQKEPNGVITDGDATMKEAVRVVFSEAVHLLCAWHLHKNAGDNIKIKEFLEEFKIAIYGDMNIAQFENFWSTMVAKHNLQEHS